MTDLWDLPFRGDDFADGDLLSWGAPQHATHVQKHGYDLTGERWHPEAGEWLQHDAQGLVNTDFHLYDTPVYAMEDGVVIAGWRNAPENGFVPGKGTPWEPLAHEEITRHPGAGSRIYGGGNGLWVQHADGTRVEYAHFRPGTVPTELCPHDEVLLPAVAQSPAVEHCWDQIRIPSGQQRSVRKGQLIGHVGNSGTGSHPHLHVHRERGGVAAETKSGGDPVPMVFRSGLSAPKSGRSPAVEWTSFAGKPIPPGPVLVWPTRVASEYARHGHPVADYGRIFAHLADSGLRPEWLDTYSVGGTVFVNHVWRRATTGWTAFHGLAPDRFSRVCQENAHVGLHPVLVSTATVGGKVQYAGVFVPGSASDCHLRQDLTEEQFLAQREYAQDNKLSPVNVSVVSVAGERRYTTLYRTEGPESWVIEAAVPEDGYQAVYETQAALGRRPVSLKGYLHQGKPFLAVVFADLPTSGRTDRSGLSAADYQREFDLAVAGGLRPRVVTAFDGAKSQHRFAACWWV